MGTLPPPENIEFSADKLEKRIYTAVEKYAEHLPVINDRYRLGYALYKFAIGEGDSPLITVKNAKVTLKRISTEEFASKLENDLKSIISK